MTRLEPCPECHRHVKVDETACPFCASALAFPPRPPRAVPRGPIGRAALFAFGVIAAPGCGSDDPPPGADAPPSVVDAAVDADTTDADTTDADPNAPDGGGIAIYSSAPTTPPGPDDDEDGDGDDVDPSAASTG